MLNIILLRRALTVPVFFVGFTLACILAFFWRLPESVVGFTVGMLWSVGLSMFTLSLFRMTWVKQGCLHSRTLFSHRAFPLSTLHIGVGQASYASGWCFVSVIAHGDDEAGELAQFGPTTVELISHSSTNPDKAYRAAEKNVERFHALIAASSAPARDLRAGV